MVNIQAIEKAVMTADEKTLKEMAGNIGMEIYSKLSPEARQRLAGVQVQTTGHPKPKFLLERTRGELIDDLSKVFREQNDVNSMNNNQLIEAWKRHGIHSGTWDWDEVVVVDEGGNLVREPIHEGSKTGVRAHKDYLQKLEDEYQKLGRKFEAGTLTDFERDRMETLALEIKQRRQELKGFGGVRESTQSPRLMKIMKVKYERTMGGAHKEMGSARVNPITGKREFHPWSGLGTFGEEVFEGETYELVDLKSGRFIDPTESGDVMYDPRIGRYIQAISGEKIDIMRLEDFTKNNSPEEQKKLLALEFETKYKGEYAAHAI